MTTLKRIKQFIDYKKLTNQKFERSVGFSNGAFSNQLKNNRTIGVDKLENILNLYPEINTEWLLTGKGNMLKETDPPTEEKIAVLNEVISIRKKLILAQERTLAMQEKEIIRLEQENKVLRNEFFRSHEETLSNYNPKDIYIHLPDELKNTKSTTEN